MRNSPSCVSVTPRGGLRPHGWSAPEATSSWLLVANVRPLPSDEPAQLVAIRFRAGMPLKVVQCDTDPSADLSSEGRAVREQCVFKPRPRSLLSQVARREQQSRFAHACCRLCLIRLNVMKPVMVAATDGQTVQIGDACVATSGLLSGLPHSAAGELEVSVPFSAECLRVWASGAPHVLLSFEAALEVLKVCARTTTAARPLWVTFIPNRSVCPTTRWLLLWYQRRSMNS